MPHATTRELLLADWRRLQELGDSAAPYSWRSPLSPRFAAVWLIRRAGGAHRRGYPRVARLLSLVNFFLFGAEVPSRLPIGPGFVLPHPQGVILGGARIGRDVTIMQHVTLGAKTLDFAYEPSLRPTVEDGVTLTAGVRVIGSVTVGAGSVVGANAVVVEDIPRGSLAVGVPARVLDRPGTGVTPFPTDERRATP